MNVSHSIMTLHSAVLVKQKQAEQPYDDYNLFETYSKWKVDFLNTQI